MTTASRGAIVLGALLAFALAGCASPAPAPAGDGGGSAAPTGIPAADGPVLGQGTVLQLDDEAPQFCLGGVMESYPPQCSGPEIEGWDWETIELKESASGVTWGTFAVVGLWDGETFTVTEDPVPLALYDPPMSEPDPRLDPDEAGNGDEDTLLAIQEQLDESELPGMLSSWPENGYLFVTVVYDDGTLQEHVDAEYGAGLVAVQSALRDVEA